MNECTKYNGEIETQLIDDIKEYIEKNNIGYVKYRKNFRNQIDISFAENCLTLSIWIRIETAIMNKEEPKIYYYDEGGWRKEIDLCNPNFLNILTEHLAVAKRMST